jgi:hypothetical protein
MQRRIWLMATVAALFGLQAPLCAIACLTSAGAESTAVHLAEPPCHEQVAQSSPPAAPPPHDDGCCEFAAEMVLPASAATSSVAALAVVPPLASQQLHASVRRAPAIPTVGDLPPPDILLLKSTLLI